VLVDPGEPVADGDIAVIRYRGHQPVVKHLYRHGKRVPPGVVPARGHPHG
jgi:SOS-response transcriptional repressor LexA